MALSLTQCRWLLHCGLGVTLQTAVASRLLDNPVPPLPVDHHGDQGRKQVGHRLREESGSSAEDCRQQEQAVKYTPLRSRDRGRDHCIIPMPVNPSIKVYWKASGMRPMVHILMAWTARADTGGRE